MKASVNRWVDDSLDYWITVATAVFSVWRAWQVEDERSSLFLLFGAAYLIIHAHGHRIFKTIKKQEREKPYP